MHACRPLLSLFLLLTAPGLALAQDAALRLPLLFADHMVLQREQAVPVWGWAAPDAEVTVTFDGADYTAQADGDGAWRVELPAMEAGGPHAMTVRQGEMQVQIDDILVGDVWVASGQSNMEWTVANANDAEAEIAAANDAMIRHFKVPQSWAEAPEPTLAGGTWEVANPETVGDFSAVGYYFARDLREHVGVPIGILNTSWGGSRIEPWMSAGTLGLSAEESARLLDADRERAAATRARIEAHVGSLPASDPGLVDGEARWAAPDLDDDAWFTQTVPGLWEGQGFEDMDGVGWYRTTFDLSADEAAEGVTLGLGMIDDSDITWVNGVEVGRTDNAWNQARVYEVPPSALQAGANVLAVRVEDFQGGGGIAGAQETLFLKTDEGRRALAETWRFMVGEVRMNSNGNKNQVPTLLWNKMIYPILPYPIAGVIWYQGESNAGTVDDAVAYRDLFPQMITSWREAWGVGDFPFLFVQLANFMEAETEPTATPWAELREAQARALTLPKTGMAVTIDIGEADDIHPRNKQDVGLRLARAARALHYGEDLVYAGPTYRDHEVRDGEVHLHFDHVGDGLTLGEATAHAFALAGADGAFRWANVRLDGDTVVVWHPDVPNPTAVRYAWGNNPDAPLYNAAGLPAVPFRADLSE